MLNKRQQPRKDHIIHSNLFQKPVSRISVPHLNLGPAEGDRLIFVSSLYSPISSSRLLVKYLIYFKAK